MLLLMQRSIPLGETPELGERDDVTELPVPGGKGADLRGERGEQVALHTVRDLRQVKHAPETLSAVMGSKSFANDPKATEF